MKRDPDLIRRSLLDIEAEPPGESIEVFTYDGRPQAEVLEHVQLLVDAGFIESHIVRGGMNEPVACVVWRMTWLGHEFLGKAKNDKLWKIVGT